MGQYSKGALTVYQARILSIQALKKSGILNSHSRAKITFPDGATMGIQHFNDGSDRYIKMSYSVSSEGEQEIYDYRINIVAVKSNLGKGEVLYFLCPVTFNRCRYLYMAYNYNKFKSREAYQNRLYYPSQKVSKLDYNNTRYWELEDEIKRIRSKTVKSHYRGLLTRKQVRLQRMELLRDRFDYKRLFDMTKSLYRAVMSA